ncbi:MAG: Ig-like domain-containing protein, partial [Paraglaciecola sp.]|uniref:Ig-like domain-containing protein n=1 Tax=Paraglaciecola sp. TaxID=1920173 RepID=UPI003298B142
MISRFKTLFSVLALVSLFSCGGGGSISRDDDDSSIGTDTDVTVTTTIELTLTDANGNGSSELAEGTPLTLTALVFDSNGDPVTDSLLTLSFQPEGLAEFGNDAGTASTNSNGVATIEILVGEGSGAGLITALLESGETATTTYNSTGTTQVSEQPASLDLYASTIQLASSGTDEIELIALVKDANNVLLEGIDVTFSADSGASLQIIQGTTEADGTARATLTTQNNQENRTIVVSAQSSVFTKSIEIDVVGTEVNVDAASSAIVDAPITVTISLVDSDGNGIENEALFVSAINGTVSSSSVTTNTSGQASIQYSSSISGADTITATALNAEGSFDIIIQEDDFSFTALPAREVTL